MDTDVHFPPLCTGRNDPEYGTSKLSYIYTIMTTRVVTCRNEITITKISTFIHLLFSVKEYIASKLLIEASDMLSYIFL